MFDCEPILQAWGGNFDLFVIYVSAVILKIFLKYFGLYQIYIIFAKYDKTIMDSVIKNIEEILVLERENNAMLKFIVEYFAKHIANFDNENLEDFIRNVIANKISSGGII